MRIYPHIAQRCPDCGLPVYDVGQMIFGYETPCGRRVTTEPDTSVCRTVGLVNPNHPNHRRHDAER
jgi:hypothetical protein